MTDKLVRITGPIGGRFGSIRAMREDKADAAIARGFAQPILIDTMDVVVEASAQSAEEDFDHDGLAETAEFTEFADTVPVSAATENDEGDDKNE